jgi:hypothetical protein
LGGAHYDRETTFKTVEQYIMKGFNELKDLSTNDLIEEWINTVKWVNIRVKSYIILINPKPCRFGFFLL